jgi:polysaccharide export outer membrane protein
MKKLIFLVFLIFFNFNINASGQPASTDRMPTYKIKAGDTLEISVYGEPDLNKTVKVSEDGKISYPFIGEIKVINLTIRGASDKIEELLKEGYFVNPQVSIFVSEYAKFFVVGAVRQEGRYELKGNLTLIEAISLAGGISDNADPSKIKVIRQGGSQEQEYIIDLDTQGKTFEIEAMDRIIVEKFGKISVLGEVNRPDNYFLKKDTALFDALAQAGGARDNANLNKIAITRKDGNKTKEYTVDLNIEGKNFILKPGDAIFVKPYEKISVLGAVNRAGSYEYKTGLTVVDAIALAGGFTEVANRNAVKVIRETKDGRRKTFSVPIGDILSSGDKSRDLLLEEGDTVSVSESLF